MGKRNMLVVNNKCGEVIIQWQQVWEPGACNMSSDGREEF